MINTNFISHEGLQWGSARVILDLPYKNAVNHLNAAFYKSTDMVANSLSPSLSKRVQEFALGILLLIPLINIYVELSLRIFSKNQQVPSTAQVPLKAKNSTIVTPSSNVVTSNTNQSLQQTPQTSRALNHSITNHSITNQSVTITSIETLSKDMIIKILFLCSVPGQINLSMASRTLMRKYKSSVRLQDLYKIARCFAKANQLHLSVRYGECISYDPVRKEYWVGQQIDYENKGKKFALVFDNNLSVIDDLSQRTTFNKSVETIIPTKDGNAIVASGYNANRIVYWNRTINEVTMEKSFGIMNRQIVDSKVLYSPLQQKFYIGNVGSLEIYDELGGEPQLTETVKFPTEKGLSQMILDDVNNHLWMVTKNDWYSDTFDGVYLIGYDLSTKQIHRQRNPFDPIFDISHDKNKNWLIGVSENKNLIVWDTITKSTILICEISLKKFEKIEAVHYNAEKKLFFFYITERDGEGFDPTTLRIAQPVSGKLMIWNIEKNTLISPILNADIFLKNRNLTWTINCVEQIYYKSNVDVVFVKFYGLIFAWDLISGCLIPNNTMSDAILENFKTKQFIINDASNELISLNESGISVMRFE